MNKTTLLLLMGMMLVLMTGVACVEESNALLVAQNQLRTSGNCAPQASLDSASLSRGTMDVMLSNRYVMFPVLLNTLEPSREVRLGTNTAGGGDVSDVLTEANIVSLSGATVSFVAPALSFPLPQEVFIPTSGAVFPGGVSATALEIISPNLGNIMRTGATEFLDENGFRRGGTVTVLVSIRFKGTTNTGVEVESNSFDFPLDICAGCLLYYAPGTIFDNDNGGLTCDQRFDPDFLGENDGTVNLNNNNNDLTLPCLVGQDEAVDCRICRTLPLADIASDPSAICDPP